MQTLVDIVKLAIANEVKAKVFYSRASELTSHGDAAMVFLELVEMEEAHAQRLVRAFDGLLQEQGVDATAYLVGLEAEAAGILSAAEASVLHNAEMRPVLEFAIGMEAKARDTYLDLAKRVAGAALRELCEDLAEEEQRHFDALTEARIGVDTPIDERPAL